MSGLNDIFKNEEGESRSITYENCAGIKGAGGKAYSTLGQGRKGSAYIPTIDPWRTVTLADIHGCGIIRHIWMTVTDKVSEKNQSILTDIVLRMYWDDSDIPSVQCPLGEFFGLAYGRTYEINSIPVAVNPMRGMNCYWPMPFKKHARITITNECDEAIPAFFYQIDYCLKSTIKDLLYFHAQYRRQRLTEKGKDYVLIDEVSGRGKYVGTFLELTTLESSWYGEGEMKFYIDNDEEFPTICGTGTEDYFGGAWSFARTLSGKIIEGNYTTAFLGYPYNSANLLSDSSNMQMHERSFYRWHILDPILFSANLKVTIQQIGINDRGMFERSDDVGSVAYWYQNEPAKIMKDLPPREERWPR